jgi:iron complex outermembrane receptor protein
MRNSTFAQQKYALSALALGLTLAIAIAAPAFAQSSAPETSSGPAPQQTTSAQPPQRITEPTVTVTAQKEPANPLTLPVSVTAVTKSVLDSAVVETPADAARYAPNTYFNEFTVRKLSNPRMRGVGSSPLNASVTTFFDGVPQLNANSSSINFLDVRQVEFVRGPQSALFGRNSLGGLVNVETMKPSMTAWTGGFAVPLGNHGAWDLNGNISGPVTDKLGVGFAIGYGERDGFTRNTVTNNFVDHRAATSIKGQVFFTPVKSWETRLIVGVERDRDGDYALNDLAALRATPFTTSRNFEGLNNRDIFSTTFLMRHEGPEFAISTTTGIVKWTTGDTTDLDYTAAPAAQRSNDEGDLQFTQEVRLANAAAAPIKLSNAAALRWQTGVFFFTQNYDQTAVNNFAPFVLSPFIAFPVAQTSPEAQLDDRGFGAYGQGTITLNERLDVTAGLRLDYEKKTADITTSFAPVIAAPTNVVAEQSYRDVSPQFGATYRIDPELSVFASAGRGFKAGGFNPTSPAGSEDYGEERTWNVEGGVKTSFAGGRGWATASVFFIDWNDLQLNQLNLAVPGQFYISNVGGAQSRGIEFEVNGRPHANVEVFGALGYTHARFGTGTTAMGANITDNILPNTPQFTGSFGTQITRPVGQLTAYGRAEVAIFGEMQYDETNTQAQDAYALADFRAGVRHKRTFVELWIKNAFDTRYIPLALPYQSASGFIGENGRPRTLGVRAGVSF